MSEIRIDKVLVSILQRRLKSITEEMSIAMTRTTRSPILCEAKDFVTGLYDAKGNMLEQTENLPILAFSLAPVCKYIIEYFGDDIHPGDVIFHNDVFSMGNQNNDVAVYKPIFFEGELVAWAACKGHQADIGGAVQGGYNPQATEVWQEALRIPPVKVIERGKLRKDVWDLIFANIRLDIVEEDMRAEIGSCVVGERGVLKILERYGREVFEAHKEYLFDATEQMMRQEIRTIPDGVYRGEATAYYDGKNPGSEYTIRVTITVKDGEIHFDYTGTDPQTPGFVNGTFTSSASATILTFLQMVNPNMPHNEGMVRPIQITIPGGTILNAAYPAATTYGNHLCPNNADAIMRALGPVIPERVTAEWNELLCSLSTGSDPRKGGEPFVDIFFMGMKGGSGGIYGCDGYDHIGMIDASGGVLDQDYEMFEQQTPHRLVRHEYWCDSAGAGRWRGGLGVETEFVMGGENVKVVTFGDGDVEPARGAVGGKDGTLNVIKLRYPDGRWYTCTSKDLVENVPAGTVYFQQAGGGGGWGDPRERDPAKVLRDVRNGVVSLEKAREDYGVAIDPATWTVDEAETERLRSGEAETRD
ncbi:hydantoinase B/oxoprolinase family protein [Deferrisoma camini]|uniref:hydantoinase B/oxoprolinase family protein n=1 Tax=Deferrisoma camini TaxID=1035120 RepID=UPI00046D8BBA|nr:hydantoinase B/oxoprolinase family protein [Deferrisoma camini]